jgi:ABC-type Fe3+-hydroxamate transport system substrate-binding protein
MPDNNLHNKTPERIISLVPSQTELLYCLGLEEKVVGITKFCVHPKEWFRTKTRIGGTKNINIDKIVSLQPDLIIANKEENVKEQVEELAKDFPVYVSDVDDLGSAVEMIEKTGELTGTQNRATAIASEILYKFSTLDHQEKFKCCYLIWKDPYMTVGGDTFINNMLKYVACKNAFGDRLRYPSVTVEEIAAANCDFIFLSSEPYPFKEKHIEELQSQIKGATIILVDGEMFSWYGSRLLHSPGYFRELKTQLAIS